MKIKWGILGIVLSLALAAPAVYAHEGGVGGWRGAQSGHQGCFMQGRMQSDAAGVFFHKAFFLLKKHDQIGLSDEQIQTVKSLSLDLKKTLIRDRADIQIDDLDIQAALRGDKIDSAAVGKLIDQKYETEKALEKSSVEAYAKLKAVLSDKQIETLKSMRKGGMKKQAADASQDASQKD